MEALHAKFVLLKREVMYATDEAVAAFVDALRTRPFFDDVRVESTRHRDVGGDAARSFRLAFLIDLDAASPIPEQPERDGEKSR